MPTTEPSCSPNMKSNSSGKFVKSGISVDPGLENILVMPVMRSTSKDASLTVVNLAALTSSIDMSIDAYGESTSSFDPLKYLSMEFRKSCLTPGSNLISWSLQINLYLCKNR